MEYEIKPSGKFNLNLSELWEYRELFYFFTWRDIKIKYKQTVFGVAWAVLQPITMMIVFTVFFGQALGIKNSVNNIPYPIFVYSGLMLWNVFSSGLSSAANSMVSNANIIKKIYFPRLIIPISAILVPLFDFIIVLVIYFGLLPLFSELEFCILYAVSAFNHCAYHLWVRIFYRGIKRQVP